MIKSGLISGCLSGILMGWSMKFFEVISGKKVYVLLLNVDFIPGLKTQNFSELTEFLLHLIIAVFIGFVFGYLVKRLKLHSVNKQFLLSFILTFPTILTFFPLTILAKKATPPPSDLLALTLWSIGHLIFAIALPAFFIFFNSFGKHRS
ncbi:hypothetical protein FIU87_08700 [Bacillus sp. THAF10]|uniref:hypothetical protein n=1 Tax=Bacillus sp. THAF10 TaxID=2587848 RepID=UPI0012698524|nr:hypothetical protein [Bacillus sp. THAF10]QFT88721.1 hypothetical protein FIU87_08700 [Bacillus sp. THAF10]